MWTDDEIDKFFERLSAYEDELEDLVYQLAGKHGIEVIYYKSEDREPPVDDIDGSPRADITRTFQVQGVRPAKSKVVKLGVTHGN